MVWLITASGPLNVIQTFLKQLTANTNSNSTLVQYKGASLKQQTCELRICDCEMRSVYESLTCLGTKLGQLVNSGKSLTVTMSSIVHITCNSECCRCDSGVCRPWPRRLYRLLRHHECTCTWPPPSEPVSRHSGWYVVCGFPCLVTPCWHWCVHWS